MDTVSNPRIWVGDVAPAAGGEPWRVFIRGPAAAPPPGGWPLLVLTDGNAVFGTACDALEAQYAYPASSNIGDGVIVAIGYPVDAAFDPLRRSFDLGPPPGKTYPPFREGGPPVRTGGAEPFLGWIETELLPFVETLAPLSKARRTLFGHSFGGLFALYALFTRPAAFEAVVSASPAIYWDDCAILRWEEALLNSAERSASLHLSAGEYEGERLPPFQEGRPDTAARREQRLVSRTADHAEDMAARLGKAGLDTSFERFAGETHMSVLPVAVARAVRTAFELRPAGGLEEDRNG